MNCHTSDFENEMKCTFQELDVVSSTREQLVKEYDSKLDEYAALLDIRANRIKVPPYLTRQPYSEIF